MRILGLLFLLLPLTACGDFHLAENIPSNKTISLKVKDYCPSKDFQLLNASLMNLSYVNKKSSLELDSDRDYISDLEEIENNDVYNTDSLDKYSNGLNYSDFFIIHTIGPDQELSSLKTCSIIQDTDNDFIDDCEEELLGLDPTNPDSDGDLIIDGLEYRSHLNALDPSDAQLDTDGDGISNLKEINEGTDPFTYNDEFQDTVKLEYKILSKEESNCYEIEVSNIHLVDVTNGNLIYLYITERSQKDILKVRYVRVLASKKLPMHYAVQVENVSDQEIIAEPESEEI